MRLSLTIFSVLISSLMNIVFSASANYTALPLVKINLTVGNTYTVDLSQLLPSNGFTCTYMVSDERVIGITYTSNPIADKKMSIVALGPGVASLKVSCNTNNKVQVFEFTVTDNKPTSMILQKNLHLEVGATHTLAPAFYPSGTSSNVTWFSTNPNVVTVEGGQLTAKAVGEATVTCITENGLREDCNVVVTPVLATSIKLNKDRIKLSAGDNFQFASEITPDENTVKKVAWSSLNPNIVTIDKDGKATCVANGWTVVVARTIDGSDLTAGCIVQVGNGLEGDINYDGMIDVDDVNQLINIILKLT